MLDLAILGLLEHEELHGYEIRRRLRDRLGLWATISFGSLYPALARLERDGAVVTTTATARPRATSAPPPTGSLSGERAIQRAHRRDLPTSRRARKVYRITDVGRRMFRQLLADGGGTEDGRAFMLRWAFAARLRPDERAALLLRRRGQLEERHRDVTAAADDASLDHYTRSAIAHAAETIDQDLGWIDRQLAAELSGERDGERAGERGGEAGEEVAPDAEGFAAREAAGHGGVAVAQRTAVKKTAAKKTAAAKRTKRTNRSTAGAGPSGAPIER